MSIPEQTWRKAERDMVQYEAATKRKRGLIRSPNRYLPATTLYKDVNGRWVAALGFFEPLKVL